MNEEKEIKILKPISPSKLCMLGASQKFKVKDTSLRKLDVAIDFLNFLEFAFLMLEIF